MNKCENDVQKNETSESADQMNGSAFKFSEEKM